MRALAFALFFLPLNAHALLMTIDFAGSIDSDESGQWERVGFSGWMEFDLDTPGVSGTIPTVNGFYSVYDNPLTRFHIVAGDSYFVKGSEKLRLDLSDTGSSFWINHQNSYALRDGLYPTPFQFLLHDDIGERSTFDDTSLQMVARAGLAEEQWIKFYGDGVNFDNGRVSTWQVRPTPDAPVPEPSSLLLLITAALALPGLRKFIKA